MDSTLTQTEPAPNVASASVTVVAAGAGDRCSNCAAQMAADQRYCLECGERGGEPRMPYMNGRQQVTEVLSPPPAGRPARPRSAASTTLVAGVGTLLLAMGVGVLIGRSNGNPQVAKTPAVQVVTVAGAGGAVAGAPTDPSSSIPSSTADASSSSGKNGSGGKGKGSAGGTSKTPAKSSAPKKTSPVVKIGAKGKGKGYKNGKFTGDFFGQ